MFASVSYGGFYGYLSNFSGSRNLARKFDTSYLRGSDFNILNQMRKIAVQLKILGTLIFHVYFWVEVKLHKKSFITETNTEDLTVYYMNMMLSSGLKY